MNEVLKNHFNESEFQRVETEIEKDNSFKEKYEKIKNDPEYRLTKLEERVEKTEATFEIRFQAFKKAVLDAEKNQQQANNSQNQSQLDKTKEEAHVNLDRIVKEKVWFGWTILGWMWIDLAQIARDDLDEKLNPSQNSTTKDINSYFSLDNIKKMLWWILLWMFWLNVEIEKFVWVSNGVKTVESAVQTWVRTIGDTAEAKKEELKQQSKKLLDEAEEKLKSRLPNFNKEKLELNPDVITKAFTSNYIQLFISKWEFDNDGWDTVIKAMENITFNEIKLKSNEKITYKNIVSEDSFNLINPFLWNKDYLTYVINSDYFKKCFPNESRITELKWLIEKNDFDWKNVFTWKEITVILSEKLAYFWATTIWWIKWVLSNSELLNNITDIWSIESLKSNLPDSAKESVDILKYSYQVQTNWNIASFDLKQFEWHEWYEYIKKVYDFSQNLLKGDWLDNLQKELGVNFVKEDISSFPLSSLSKLYLMLNWKWDISQWWDTEKISFITWFSHKLSDSGSDKHETDFTDLWSALIKKVLIETNDWSFISKWVKEFFKSGASIYWRKFAKDEIIWPYNQIKWILRNNLPDSLKFDEDKVNKYIEDSAASVAMALWLLIMIYPAYRITKFITNKSVLLTVIWGTLLYSQIKDTKWLDNVSDSIKELFDF